MTVIAKVAQRRTWQELYIDHKYVGSVWGDKYELDENRTMVTITLGGVTVAFWHVDKVETEEGGKKQ